VGGGQGVAVLNEPLFLALLAYGVLALLVTVTTDDQPDEQRRDESTREVLKQLVDAIEDDHAGDMTPLWAEARRILGEAK